MYSSAAHIRFTVDEMSGVMRRSFRRRSWGRIQLRSVKVLARMARYETKMETMMIVMVCEGRRVGSGSSKADRSLRRRKLQLFGVVVGNG